MGLLLRSSKPLTLTMPLYLPECSTFHSKLPRSRAIVTPVAKSPHATDPMQIRPISLTSVVCKIFETILKEKLLSHESQLSLLITRQHGFLSRRSTVTNRNNVARATKKPMECFLTQSDPSRPSLLVFSSRCTKRLFAQVLNMQFKHPPPILSRDCQALESVQRLASSLLRGCATSHTRQPSSGCSYFP